MEKNHHTIDFNELVSQDSRIDKSQLDLIYGIDIDQVQDFRSFFDYFKLEFGTYAFTLILALSVFFFREGPVFISKDISLTSWLIILAFGLRHSLVFSLFLDKDREYMKHYETIKGKREDKWSQIRRKFGILGLIFFIVISLVPFVFFIAMGQF